MFVNWVGETDHTERKKSFPCDVSVSSCNTTCEVEPVGYVNVVTNVHRCFVERVVVKTTDDVVLKFNAQAIVCVVVFFVGNEMVGICVDVSFTNIETASKNVRRKQQPCNYCEDFHSAPYCR